MGFGDFFSSTSEATQTQVAADNEAQGGSGSNQAREGSVVVAPSKGIGLYTSPGATTISGSNLTDASRQALVSDNAKTGDVSLTQISNDPDLIKSLIGTFADSTKKQTEALTQLLTPPQAPEERPSSQVETESWWTTGRKWAVGIVVAALLGWIFFPKKGRA